MDMAETILVTGATGTVESEVIKQLSRATTDINIKAAVHSAENVKGAKDVDRVLLLAPFQSDMVKLLSNLLKGIENTGNIKNI
jgi:uncharacterized protein YbjT (DUF2867 family)